YE
ncbi:polysaccharide biosynthesis/export family protein, partial [Vibrio parahaemolyticus VPTS-2010]